MTASVFCGDCPVRTQPGGFFSIAEALVLKFSTHKCMALLKELFRDEQY
jgi:hypothetical protein